MDNAVADKKVKAKKAKKPKSPKPFYNEFVCPPSNQAVKGSAVAAGFACRALLIYASTLGILLFITDAFLIKINLPVLAAVTAVFVALFAVMSLGRKLFFAGIAALAAFAAAFMALSADHTGIVINSVGAFWDQMLDRLSYAGYRVADYLYISFGRGTMFTDERLSYFMLVAASMLSALVAAVLTVSLIRRTRVLPTAIVFTVVLTTVFTYNISTANWGFALIVASVCGIITMKIYDGLYNRGCPKVKDGERKPAKKKKAEALKNSALGGTMGFFACCLSFIVLLPSAVNVNDQWQKIDFISERMERGRAIISSIIIGDAPNINMGFIGNMDTLNARSTVADKRTFTGEKMLTIYASYNMPLYLRSWAASSYDNEADCWSTVSSAKAAQYASYFPGGFSPEVISYNFYNFLSPALTKIGNFTSYSNHIEDGFITETVDVVNENSSGNLLFTAATYNPELGLLNYMTKDAADSYGGEWKFYYDGIITTSWFNFNKKYRMTSFVPSYRYEDYGRQLSDNIEYYTLMKSFITQYKDVDLSESEQAQAVDSASAMLDAAGIKYTAPTALERYFALDEAGRADFIYKYFTLPDYYESFVKSEYTSVPASETLDTIAAEIRAELSAKYPLGATAHQTALAVVDYLRDNYEYSLSPRAPKNRSLSALDAFLTDTKQGYCVQFATSATMLLRTLGIPARYVEGYYVESLTYDKSTDRLAKYHASVRDFNAHAWVEVYMGAAGWKLYETTPVYYSDLYEPYKTSSGGTVSFPEETYPETTYLSDDSGVSPAKKPFKISARMALIIAGAAVSAAALVLAVVVITKLRSKSIRAYEKRYETLNRALRSQLEPEEMRSVARQINDYIWDLHKIAGCMPQTGELPSEYALRVDDAVNPSLFSFNDILSYMNREEFGRGMERWQLREEAEYMQSLWDKQSSAVKGFKKFKYRYIKRMI